MRNLLVLSFALWIAVCTADAEWVLGPVDTLTSNDVYDETGSQSLAIDSSGTLHLTWRQEDPEGGWKILYRTKPFDQPWTAPVEIPIMFANNCTPAVAVEYEAGVAHVVWDGLSGDCEIFYSTNLTGDWVTAVLTENDHADVAPAIATDTAGNVHITWIGYDTLSEENKIFYATDESGNWEIQIVEESVAPSLPGTWGSRPSIGVTSGGIAHITYTDCDGLWCEGGIHHLENYSLGDTGWSDESLETGNYTDVFSSIAVDEDGALHLAMSGPIHPDIPAGVFLGHYFFRPDTSEPWDCTEIDRWCGTSPVLKLDTLGVHHIVADFAWMGPTPYIFYYSDISSNWQKQLVLEGSSTREKPSVVIDQAGFGHLVFFNNRRWATPPGEIFYTKSVESLTSLGSFIRGDADPDGSVGMSDALYILAYLYVPGSPSPSCMDAADVDDNGEISMQDAVYLLRYAYVPGGPPPPPPFPELGYDPTWEGIGCANYPSYEYE